MSSSTTTTDADELDAEEIKDALSGVRWVIPMAAVVDGDAVEVECRFKRVQNGAALSDRLPGLARAAADALDEGMSLEVVAHFGNQEVATVRCTFEAADLEALAAGDLGEDAFRLQMLRDLERVI